MNAATTDRIVRPTWSARAVRILLKAFILLAFGSVCATARAQDLLDAPPPDIQPAGAAQLTAADAANLEGCQVIARIDDQIILACDVLWRVNLLLEGYQQRMPANQQMK